MKLSVQFQGEEGIDAGGVSREWYQVSQASSCKQASCCSTFISAYGLTLCQHAILRTRLLRQDKVCSNPEYRIYDADHFNQFINAMPPFLQRQ